MKSLFTLLCVFFCVHVFSADTIRLQRAANNAVYVGDASKSIKPGSVVLLEGNYLFYKVLNVKGTADSPVVFINKGLVRIGGFTAYTFQVTGQHFIISGSGDSGYKYGILLNSDTAVSGTVFGFNADNSTDFEVHHLECMNSAQGIVQNPRYGIPMNNVFYHHIYIHDLRNPTVNAPGRGEGFYLGSTADTTPYNATYRFHNCRVEDCYLENLCGDGIQIGTGEFIIRRDTVVNWGTAHVVQQNNGVQVGGGGSAVMDSLVLLNGQGIGIIILGVDSVILTNSSISSTYLQGSQLQDVIYINGKGPVPLNMRFQNNFINSCTGRYGINSATPSANTNGSVFIDNFITGTYTTKPYGMQPKDRWIMSNPPIAYNAGYKRSNLSLLPLSKVQ